MISLRLDPTLEQQLNTTAQNLGLTRSEFIRKSIIHYIDMQTLPNAWETGKNLFGKYSSGKNHLSVDRKKILKDKIRLKRENAENSY